MFSDIVDTQDQCKLVRGEVSYVTVGCIVFLTAFYDKLQIRS